MSQTIDQVFRDYKTQGVPASGEHEPDKAEIRAGLKAWLLGASKGVLDRRTVALLLADTVFSYVGGEGKILVAAGEIVTAQGFRYEVAASGAADNDLVTAGGVKLYVMDTDPASWGAEGDGIGDDTSFLSSASAHNSASKPTYRTTLPYVPAEVRGDFDLILASPERRHSFDRIEGRPLTPPAGFGWTPPILPLFENNRWRGSVPARWLFPAVDGATYYVDPVYGSDSNAGTDVAPLATITAALNKADVGEVMVAPIPPAMANVARGIWGNPSVVTSAAHVIVKPWNIRVGRPVVARSVEHNATMWSASGASPNTVYNCAVATKPTQLLEFGADPDGKPVLYVEDTRGQSTVANRPGSWYWSGGTLYVHAMRGGAPGPSLKILQGGTCCYWPSNKGLYVDGFDFIGGLHPVWIPDQSCDVIFVNCRAIGGAENGFSINTSGTVILEGCASGLHGLDSYNYHKPDSYDPGTVIEVGCRSLGPNGAGLANNNQVSTIHQAVKIVRIGCDYSDTIHQVIADITLGSQAWNVGLQLGTSMDEHSRNVGVEMATEAEGWFYDCDFGHSRLQLAANSNSIIHLHNSYPSRYVAQNGGSIDSYQQQ